MSGDAYERGLKKIKEIDGADGRAWHEHLAAIHADFARLVVGYSYGAVWGRPGLSDRDRSLATIAALIAAESIGDELRSHMALGLKNGLTADEIYEIVIHMTVYAGIPVAIRALELAHEVCGPNT